MRAFDTDILTLLQAGYPPVVERVRGVPADEQAVPVVVVEEQFRGRLDVVRQAQAGKGRVSLAEAYERLASTLDDLKRYRVLPYTAAADDLYRQWRAAKIRVGSQDLRIAAVAVAHKAKLTTRNARDFRQVPGLDLDVWS